MARKIEIYEFSRAFENVHYSDKYNSWVSGGYASEKINRFNKTPHPDIRKAVTSGYFSLNDSYPPVNGEVALIGCDLGIYSLLAVANGQIDDGNRPTIGYRYFWLEKEKDDTEIDGLGTILSWWLQSEKPQFDMEKARYQETPEVSLTDVVTRETFKAEFEAAIANIVSEPLIPYIKVVNSPNYWLQKYPDYIQCHYIAYYFSLDYDRNLTWAWNVRRLIHPENFISIYAATERDLPNVSRIRVPKITEDNQQPIIKINQQNSQIEECLKDIESRFTSQKNLQNSLQNTGKLNELLEYLAEPENFNIDRRFYDNSQIYRALLALIVPDETKIWLNSCLCTDNLETSKLKLSLSLHQQLFAAAKQHNQRAYEYLYKIVDVHIADLLLKLVLDKNKQYVANIKYLLSETWNLPFKEYAQNLKTTLFSFLENQERNKESDKFHNYVLNNLQEIQTQFRNKEQFFDRGNKFAEIVQIFKQNGFTELTSIFIFFDNKKLDNDTSELLKNFLIPLDTNVRVKTKSNLDNRLFSVLITQPIQMITSIILLPITILFGTNRQAKPIDNDDSEFPKAAFLGFLFILIGAAIVFLLGNQNIARITSIFSCIIGGFVLLGSAVRFQGNDILSKLLFAFMLLGIGGITYYFAYNHQLPPSQNTSMNYITSLGNLKIL
ncbi:MAG: hypothetical protein RMZ41_002815 [Nostoc sp. DedVER02]|uniref:hypothetical protein n=1 Tax=unclassified Nostoc TaxID=2593658 RepID=UPI002AD4375C|nr:MULTISPECIES: hypothetical protein [unclassified Nostoc]MDZ7986909.1 hypothetical protein [Nostoc sp. DedVER02]MDZ8115811.1 hypothetical protein [Nostoc sp. DedVER01b]